MLSLSARHAVHHLSAHLYFHGDALRLVALHLPGHTLAAAFPSNADGDGDDKATLLSPRQCADGSGCPLGAV